MATAIKVIFVKVPKAKSQQDKHMIVTKAKTQIAKAKLSEAFPNLFLRACIYVRVCDC